MLSQRIKNIKESGIRMALDKQGQGGKELINLSIGQPHFHAPDWLKEAAKKAIDDDFSYYMPNRGYRKLREKIALDLQKDNNIPAKPEEVIVTSGVSGAIFLLFSAIIDPGDEVILPEPYFVLYREVLDFLGADIVYIDTYPDFQLDPDKISKSISQKTKAIILNSPNNPTGAVYGRNPIEAVAGLAKQKDILIVSDEIYSKYDYENRAFSPASIYPKTATLNGFSKSHAIPGWRAGYAHGPLELIDAMNKLQQYTFVNASSIAQAALSAEEDTVLDDHYKEYKAKRDLVWENLRDLYEFTKPQGAFYAFIKIPPGRDNFIEEALEEGLVIVSGSAFSSKKDHFRISFAASEEALGKGIDILKKLSGQK